MLDVHDHIGVVDQHPPAKLQSLGLGVHLACRFEAYVELVVERLHVGTAGRRHHHEVVRDPDLLGNVVDADIGGLLLLGEVGGRRG